MANYPADDSFKASKKICELILPGVAAIFGPVSATSSNHVQVRRDVTSSSSNHVQGRRDVTGTSSNHVQVRCDVTATSSNHGWGVTSQQHHPIMGEACDLTATSSITFRWGVWRHSNIIQSRSGEAWFHISLILCESWRLSNITNHVDNKYKKG